MVDLSVVQPFYCCCPWHISDQLPGSYVQNLQSLTCLWMHGCGQRSNCTVCCNIFIGYFIGKLISFLMSCLLKSLTRVLNITSTHTHTHLFCFILLFSLRLPATASINISQKHLIVIIFSATQATLTNSPSDWTFPEISLRTCVVSITKPRHEHITLTVSNELNIP